MRRFTELPSKRCEGRWIEVYRALVHHPIMLRAIEVGHRKHTACPYPSHPVEQRHGDAFRVRDDFAQTGRTICSKCGTTFGFKGLMLLNDWDAKTTARKLVEFLDGVVVDSTTGRRTTVAQLPPAPLPIAHRRSEGPPLWRIMKTWDEAVALDHPLAEPVHRYFLMRGLYGLPLFPDLRCHPGLGYYVWDEVHQKSCCIGEYPVLLSLVRDVTGRAIGLHRIYLTSEGTKAPVPEVKKLLIAQGEYASGASVQLMKPGTMLSVVEGVETTLAVYLGTETSVWSGISASLVGSLRVPDHVRYVADWADFDKLSYTQDGRLIDAGRDAAEKLAARMLAERRDCIPVYPKLGRRGVDWLDVWVEKGKAGFPNVRDLFRTRQRAFFAGWLGIARNSL